MTAGRRWLLGAGLAYAAILLAVFKIVIMKMLPFDNKSEFQVVVDMPAGTPLEQTARAMREIGGYLSTVPEVTDFEAYVGKLLKKVGPRKSATGGGWTMIHIDSWEMGSQNWTGDFREQFKKRRGYD
jgi:multidrug efflux pump subunit AcrB